MLQASDIRIIHLCIPDRLEVDRAANLLQNGLPSLSVDNEDTLSGTRSLRSPELSHVVR